MAHYQTSIVAPRSVEETFAFVSDFRHAPTWDPRTYEAEKLTDGPIGLGTKFLLIGGLLPKTSSLARSRLLRSLLGGSKLPYEIVEYAPSQAFTLAGETLLYRYRDRIQFSAESGHTRIVYTATMELKGIFKLGEPVLRLLFRRIGDEATQGIPDAVARGVGACR